MKITKIIIQKKDANRVNVFIDDKYSLSLSVNQLLAEKLKVNQNIDDHKLEYLLKVSQDGKQKIKVFNWLLLRPHSIKEYKEYISKNKIDTDLAQKWQIEFQKFGYLDDVKFAKFWVENRKKKLKSNRIIIAELKQKGLEDSVIRQFLETDIGDKEILSKLIANKRRQLRYQDNIKLTRYLVGKGYDYSLVKALLADDSL